MCSVILLVINILFLYCGESWAKPNSGSENGCILPAQPDNGQWKVLNGNGNPGEKIDTNTILQFSCNSGYKLIGNAHLICLDGWSMQKVPQCAKLCPPLYSSATTIFHCTDRAGETIPCNETSDGSYLTYECIPFYEPPLGHRKTLFCIEGHWNFPKPQCQPVCGKKIDAKKLIYGGQKLDKLVYPWIVAIYMNETNLFNNVCGGTIISRNVILTAAHCVTNEYSEALATDKFRVAAAKLYNKYQDPRDEDAQYLEISRVIVHPQYKGESRRFLGDLAILVTKQSFKLGPLVQPACISDLNAISLHSGIIGEIAGWGVTEDGYPSDELKAVEIPYKSETLCASDLPESWAEKYNLLDKICAGHPQKNISVCKGDSGSGLVFKNFEDNRYYVHGIVSLAPASGGTGCNIVTSALYTKVVFYYNFIDSELSRLSGCKLPPYPENGKWITENFPSKVPGDIVDPEEILTFRCDNGYKLTTNTANFDCESVTSTMPACQGSKPVMECGRKIEGSTTELTAEGDEISHSEQPWVAVIYEGRNIRGLGTIISKRIVVTVAYSATRENTVVPLDPEVVKVAVGKFYRFYGDPRDTGTRYLEVSNVIVFDGYKGLNEGIYGDIGLFVTKYSIEFNKWVQPVCFIGLNTMSLRKGDFGDLAGFSDKVKDETDSLNSFEVFFKTPKQCFKETPHWLSFLSADVICGAAPNKTVCTGDAGASWVFKNPNDGRYYIHALLGLSKRTEGKCVPGENAIFVSLKYHYDFILENIKKFD